MHQRPPRFMAQHAKSEIAGIFGLEEKDFLAGYPLETVSTGTAMLMAPLVSKAALARVAMDSNRYRAYRAKSDFFSPHFFVLEGETPEGDTFARHLGTPPDTLEDAFTGSATGAMGAYLWKHGLIKEKFYAEQGHWMGRPGRALVENQGKSISVAGPAITLVQGKLTL